MNGEMRAFLESDLFKIASIIIIAMSLQFLAHLLIGRFVRRTIKRQKGETTLDERKRQKTVITILSTTLISIIWICAIIGILTILGVNVTAILTGAGIIGVIVGLSVQNTVKDFLAGFFILTEKQYRVGDVISVAGGSTGVNGATGTVEEITLRITKLRDENGTLTTVRNGEPTVITNKTYTYSGTMLDIAVTYDSDIDELERIIDRLGKAMAKEPEWKDKITTPIQFLRVESFTDNGVVVRVIGTVAPASQWEVAGEFRKRLLKIIAKESKVSLAHDK